MTTQWFVNVSQAFNVELFEVTNAQVTESYVAYSRLYSDGTPAPMISLHKRDIPRYGIFDTKNEAIDHGQLKINELKALEQEKIVKADEQLADLEAQRDPVP